jgi:hypothetical protein
VNQTNAKVQATVKATGFMPGGRVQVMSGGKVVGKGVLKNGKVTVTLKRFKTTGKKTVHVKYLGNALAKASKDTITIHVVNK